ncbi:adenine deaminase C-terminal domain-containing protein [Spongiactinospora sp. TRM90649]|uniref:adenine deaminase C-terminal domain-containing protein n=1 Tax=Spongiactinospora sp. TRM90649 TaxID=3031114 RepID=UPI0023F9B612|nr:adenine deaminase C-terminal domain-containing protein [Spongiactinospora sp. TRM90649]MDF5752138.1 adenine deaminase C-terminal domain-containing protein [Spongiactinospora sp. TRM90649]
MDPSSTETSPAGRRHAADVAAGREPADLVITGGRIVDVLSGRIYRGDVAVAGARIAAVGDVAHCVGDGTAEVDATGLFVLPGFIDPHFHVGFSQVTVERLAELLVPMGTVALSSCFSESGYIAGRRAVETQLERGAGTGLDALLSPFHAAALGLGEFGCLNRFSIDDLRALVEHEQCVELREWNDDVSRLPVPGLAGVWAEALKRGRVIAGHMEGLSGPAVQAAVAQGVASDHEVTTVEEALERVRLGVTVQLREGSSAQDLLNVLPAITEFGADPSMFSACSDEQELHSLAELGHQDHKLRVLVRNGVAPVDAVRMVTLNAARSLGLERHYGAVLPGRLASLALVEDLASFRVVRTFSRGRLCAENGEYLLPSRLEDYPAEWNHMVRLGRALTRDDFRLPVADGTRTLRVIGITPGSLRTDERSLDLPVRDGGPVADDGLDIAKIAVADRHEATGRLATALISGLGVRRGAIAATINAGVMNLMVVGVDDADMALAANRCAELEGGIVVVRDGVVRAEVALPTFGIVSHAPLAETLASSQRVAQAIRGELGSPLPGLVPSAGFACLAVSIPGLKMTEYGLVRVSRGGHRERVPITG